MDLILLQATQSAKTFCIKDIIPAYSNYVLQAYPFEINWNDVYSDPAQPLVVDIGSGIFSF